MTKNSLITKIVIINHSVSLSFVKFLNEALNNHSIIIGYEIHVLQ